jgi:plasmid maintenance system antidote protein VapI
MSQLSLSISREPRPVSNAELSACSTWAKALTRAAELSGIPNAKAQAAAIEMDPAQYSKTLSGQLGLMPDKLFALMDVFGTEFPLMWLNYQRGYDIEAMRHRETELQRQLREVREQLEAERKKNDHIAEFFAKARAA